MAKMTKESMINVAKLTGLEIMQAMIRGDLPRPSITDTVPMVFGEASSGFIKFRATADKRHLNPMGGVHGGFAATVLDSVTGCAVHTMLEAGEVYSTVDLNVKMLKPIPLATELLAEGKVIHISKSIGVAEGTIKTLEGVLLAHATSTCLIKRTSSG
jgi:uncharacterized protein (TIGR00369 family)